MSAANGLTRKEVFSAIRVDKSTWWVRWLGAFSVSHGLRQFVESHRFSRRALL